MENFPLADKSKSSTPRIGVGLRSPHVKEILTKKPDIDFFELLTDNHLAEGGYARQQAHLIREYYPVSLHCVGMSLGGCDPLDFSYLNKIKKLASELKPIFISDHLCWTSFDKQHAHDLLPLPYTNEAINHVSNRIIQIQEILETTLVIENVSSYLTYSCSEMDEWDFLTNVAKQAQCKILLDINNIYVSQFNNDLDANKYLNQIPLDLIAEIHLAGYEDKGKYLLDSHNNKVSLPVWELYKILIERDHSIPTLIEWDNNIPPLSILLSEADKARNLKQLISSNRNHETQNEVCHIR